MGNPSHLRIVGQTSRSDDEQQALNAVSAALADPVRRQILDRLDGHDLLVSEIAEGAAGWQPKFHYAG